MLKFQRVKGDAHSGYVARWTSHVEYSGQRITDPKRLHIDVMLGGVKIHGSIPTLKNGDLTAFLRTVSEAEKVYKEVVSNSEKVYKEVVSNSR